MNTLKKFIYLILSIQEKFLLKKLSKTLNAKNISKSKKMYSQGCFLNLETLANSEKEKLEEELLLILKNTNYEPKKVLNYIQNQGTKVFYIKNTKNLYSIGENEGFILPAKGFKALYLSLLTENKFKFKTKELFILTKGEINLYYFIYHFYNWFAFKNGIAGLDSNSQSLLKKYLFNNKNEDFSKLQLDDIYKLKDAIKQDKASIEFVFKLCQKLESSHKAFENLKNNGANL